MVRGKVHMWLKKQNTFNHVSSWLYEIILQHAKVHEKKKVNKQLKQKTSPSVLLLSFELSVGFI